MGRRQGSLAENPEVHHARTWPATCSPSARNERRRPGACDDLLKAYRDDKDHPGLWPVVEVGTGYFMSKEYGQIAKPVFTVADWAEPWAEPSGGLLTLPAPTGGKGGNGAKAIEAPKSNEAPRALTTNSMMSAQLLTEGAHSRNGW